jgi:hypothetical protein
MLVIGLEGRLFEKKQLLKLIFLNWFFCIRLPFIENIEYIDLRRKIIKVLVQIRVLLRNLRLVDQINMPKSKLILEVNERKKTMFLFIYH